MKKMNMLAFMMLFSLSTTAIFTGCDSGSNTSASDGATPTITLRGKTNIEIPLGTTVLEEGYSAFDFQDGDLTDNVTVSSSIDWTKAGTYTVTYNVTDSDGNVGTATRTIKIIANSANSGSDNDGNYTYQGDTPTISFDSDTVYLVLGESFLNSHYYTDYSATDTEDGDITNKVQIDVSEVNINRTGAYIVTYSVTDSNGNYNSKDKKVVVQTESTDNGTYTYEGDTPSISFNRDTVYLVLGENFLNSHYYTDYSATDTEDGDLTNQIQIDASEVNINKTGTYIVTYYVTDSNGNYISKDKRVVIQNNYNDSDNNGNINTDTELDTFKLWYSDTCGRTFNESLYDASTLKYHGKIDCSNQGLSSIDLSPLAIFDGIDDLDLSYNNLSYIDFSPIQDISEMWGLHIDHNTATLKRQYDTQSERVELFKYFTNIHGGNGNTYDSGAGLNIYFKQHQIIKIFFDEDNK